MEKFEDSAITSICILETQELERKRISMELHDTTVQSLTNLIHKTEFVGKLMDIDLVRAKLELNTMSDIIRASINELREIIYELRPMAIDDLGLVLALEQYIQQLSVENDLLDITLEVDSDENRNVLPIINLTLFRVIQEALTNVQKHARATKVDIHLLYTEATLEIQIRDNGVGFNIDDHIKEKTHYGLSMMEERVKLLSGLMGVESDSNGTKIELSIPIVEEDKNETDKHSYCG